MNYDNPNPYFCGLYQFLKWVAVTLLRFSHCVVSASVLFVYKSALLAR